MERRCPSWCSWLMRHCACTAQPASAGGCLLPHGALKVGFPCHFAGGNILLRNCLSGKSPAPPSSFHHRCPMQCGCLAPQCPFAMQRARGSGNLGVSLDLRGSIPHLLSALVLPVTHVLSGWDTWHQQAAEPGLALLALGPGLSCCHCGE